MCHTTTDTPLDFRRHVRPFFLDAVTGRPTSKKPYYDFITYLITQIVFSFATTPFLTLTFRDSWVAWRAVYFYGVIWVVGALAFFSSPGKAFLRQKLEQRKGRASARLVRSISTESLTEMEPILGISKDLEGEIQEAVEELKAEMRKKEAAKNESKKTA